MAQKQYTDIEAVENYTLQNIAGTFDAQIGEWIDAMSEYIDQQAGFPVWTDEPSTYRYDGSGSSSLLIRPVSEISEVTVDDAAVEPLEKPYNTAVKTELVLSSGIFPRDLANVEVTGVHCLKPGEDVPPMIKWACTVLVAGIVNQSNNQSEGVASEKIGDYSVSYRTEKERGDYARALEIIQGLRPLVF